VNDEQHNEKDESGVGPMKYIKVVAVIFLVLGGLCFGPYMCMYLQLGG